MSEREARLEQALRDIQLRTRDRPAWYIRRDGRMGWWVTDFTYEQMEGNRQRMHDLATKALES